MKTKLTIYEFMTKFVNKESVDVTDLYKRDRDKYNPIVYNNEIRFNNKPNYGNKAIVPTLIVNHKKKEILITDHSFMNVKRDGYTNLYVWSGNIVDLYDIKSNSIFYNLISRFPIHTISIIRLYDMAKSIIRRNKYLVKYNTKDIRYKNPKETTQLLYEFRELLKSTNSIIISSIFTYYEKIYISWSNYKLERATISLIDIAYGHSELVEISNRFNYYKTNYNLFIAHLNKYKLSTISDDHNIIKNTVRDINNVAPSLIKKPFTITNIDVDKLNDKLLRYYCNTICDYDIIENKDNLDLKFISYLLATNTYYRYMTFSYPVSVHIHGNRDFKTIYKNATYIVCVIQENRLAKTVLLTNGYSITYNQAMIDIYNSIPESEVNRIKASVDCAMNNIM